MIKLRSQHVFACTFVLCFILAVLPSQPIEATVPLSSNAVSRGGSVDWWLMFHHDLNHTAYSTSTAPNTNHTVWSYTTGSYVFSSPVVVEGKVYIGSGDQKVYCLGSRTGDCLWNYTTGGRVFSSPAVADGNAYVGSEDDKVYCLNASTGALVWNYTTNGWVWSSPADANGMVYVGSKDGKVYCLNASTGALMWSYATGSYALSSPAVAGEMVYAGSMDDNVYCLNALNGTLMWKSTTGYPVFSSPAVADNMVYVGSEDNNVYCLYGSNGSLAWSYTTGDQVDSSPAVANGMVYVASEDGKVYCLNANTGALVWSHTTVGQVDCSPAVADGMVYVGSDDDHVYCLNASDGTIVWSYSTGSSVFSSPAVAGGMVYLGSEDHNVYCFGPSQTYTYSVSIGANCYTESVDVSVSISMDGSPSGYVTPCTFTGLTGTHTFAVPSADTDGHAFLDWNTGQMATAIPVSSGGAYTAYYVASSETLVPVPFHYQEKDCYCGPACLQMVFNYYSENIMQAEIACVARTVGFPAYTTYEYDLTRAAQFSNISTSKGDELPYNVTGYSLRQLGYSASESQGMNLTMLESFLDQGKPLILLMWYSSSHVDGHFRVAVGYNQTHVFLHDPRNAPLWGGSYGGPDTALNISQFLDLWSYFDYWALYVSPWNVNFSAPTHVSPGMPFQVESTVIYPQPLPNAISTYPASSCNASITLPANLSLALGENQTKIIGTGLMQAGTNQSVSWMLVANSSITGTVGVTAEGTISGSVGAHDSYPAYDYSDRTGAISSFTVNFTVSLCHDVAVTTVMSARTVIGQDCAMDVSINVTNQGDYPETFNVTAYANATATETEQVIALPSGNSSQLVFTWNTSGFAYGKYSICAAAWPVPNETDTTNNNCTAGWLTVSGIGDLTGLPNPLNFTPDGVVNMTDVGVVASFFLQPIPPAPANCDITGPTPGIPDGVIDMMDVGTVAAHYDQQYW